MLIKRTLFKQFETVMNHFNRSLIEIREDLQWQLQQATLNQNENLAKKAKLEDTIKSLENLLQQVSWPGDDQVKQQLENLKTDLKLIPDIDYLTTMINLLDKNELDDPQWWQKILPKYNSLPQEYRPSCVEITNQLLISHKVFQQISSKNDFDKKELYLINNELHEVNIFTTILSLRDECDQYRRHLKQTLQKTSNETKRSIIDKKIAALDDLIECISHSNYEENPYSKQLDFFKEKFNSPPTNYRNLFKQYPDSGTEKFLTKVKIALSIMTAGLATIGFVAYSHSKTGSLKFWQSEGRRLNKRSNRSIKSLEQQHDITYPTTEELQHKYHNALNSFLDHVLKPELGETDANFVNPSAKINIDDFIKTISKRLEVEAAKTGTIKDTSEIDKLYKLKFQFEKYRDNNRALQDGNLSDDDIQKINHDIQQLHLSAIVIPLEEKCKALRQHLQESLNTNTKISATKKALIENKIQAMNDLIECFVNYDSRTYPYSNQIDYLKMLLDSPLKNYYRATLERSADSATKAFLKTMNTSLAAAEKITSPQKKKQGRFPKFWRYKEKEHVEQHLSLKKNDRTNVKK